VLLQDWASTITAQRREYDQLKTECAMELQTAQAAMEAVNNVDTIPQRRRPLLPPLLPLPVLPPLPPLLKLLLPTLLSPAAVPTAIPIAWCYHRAL
jgi:hypothetical protein